MGLAAASSRSLTAVQQRLLHMLCVNFTYLAGQTSASMSQAGHPPECTVLAVERSCPTRTIDEKSA